MMYVLYDKSCFWVIHVYPRVYASDILYYTIHVYTQVTSRPRTQSVEQPGCGRHVADGADGAPRCRREAADVSSMRDAKRLEMSVSSASTGIHIQGKLYTLVCGGTRPQGGSRRQ